MASQSIPEAEEISSKKFFEKMTLFYRWTTYLKDTIWRDNIILTCWISWRKSSRINAERNCTKGFFFVDNGPHTRRIVWLPNWRLFYKLNRTVLAKLMNEEESWLYIYDSKNKKLSKEWYHSRSLRQKKFHERHSHGNSFLGQQRYSVGRLPTSGIQYTGIILI